MVEKYANGQEVILHLYYMIYRYLLILHYRKPRVQRLSTGSGTTQNCTLLSLPQVSWVGETKRPVSTETPQLPGVKKRQLSTNKPIFSLRTQYATHNLSGQKESTSVLCRGLCPVVRWGVVVRSRQYRTGHSRACPRPLLLRTLLESARAPPASARV